MYIFVSITVGTIIIIKLYFSNDQNYDYKTDYLNYTVGARIIHDGNTKSLYDYETQRSYYEQIVPIGQYIRTYRSLPFVAKALAPISYLNFTDSLKIQVSINLILYAAVLYLYVKSNKQYISLLLLSIGFMPFGPAVFNGQVTLIMASALGLAYFFLCPQNVAKGNLLKKEYPFISGLVFSLILLKPHFALLALFLMLLTKKKWQFLSGFALGSIALVSIGVKELGNLYIIDYLKFLMVSEDAYNGTQFANVSSSQGLFELFIGTHYAFYATIVLSTMLLPILFWRYYKKMNSFTPDIQLLIPTIIITTLSLHVFEHDRVLMLIPLAMLGASNKKSLYFFIHIMSYLGISKLMPLVFLYYLFLGIYLLEGNLWKRFLG